MNTNLLMSQSLQESQQEKLESASRMRPRDREKIEQAAKDFEQIFLSQAVASMRKDVKLEKPFGGGFAEEMYQGLLADEYAKAMVNSGGIGVADAVKRELMHLQEVK